ncbi:NADP-dependent oxidoreductase domain-containing protein [Xylogone sp. PMI_703]|nr:NADP-dependent oxidoreductase domain-containing protein [Xylogone sp. PMI_703]
MLPPSSFPLTNTPIRIPSRGLGTFQADPKLYPEASVKASVLQAIKCGYRHIDAAYGYGLGSVEREVGAAIAECGIPREEIFVVTKLHHCFHAPEDVEVNMDMSLKNLGLDYVDLYLMHFPIAYELSDGYVAKRKPDGKPVLNIPLTRAYDVTWAAMEKLVEKGKTRLIAGVSNFSSPKLARLLKTCKIFPVVNQIEIHPYFPQKSLVEYCQSKGVHVTAYCPLGGAPMPALAGRTGPGPLEDASIRTLAEKYNKTPAQIILYHTLSRGISVIPKTNNPSRIAENWDVLFELEEEDFMMIDNLMGEQGERGVRNLEMKDYLGFDVFSEERDEP